jgi:hypothetical protein
VDVAQPDLKVGVEAALKGKHAATESSGGCFELSLAHWPVRDPTADTLSDDQVRAAVIDDIVQRLAEPFGALAQEQLNILVTVIDHAHRELLQANRQPLHLPKNSRRTSRHPRSHVDEGASNHRPSRWLQPMKTPLLILSRRPSPWNWPHPRNPHRQPAGSSE